MRVQPAPPEIAALPSFGYRRPVNLRLWREGDVQRLAEIANDLRVWRGLEDRFPHPYTRRDAEAWIAHCRAAGEPHTQFAIEEEGVVVGGIGFTRLEDVHRLTAKIGYWLSPPWWGRGLATRALREATRHAFERFDLVRLQATVFDWNAPSARVLEKAGYLLEARLRSAVVKEGRICDALLYARLRGV
jgi:RimJ/RimL family protein N-acetyltransferase